MAFTKLSAVRERTRQFALSYVLIVAAFIGNCAPANSDRNPRDVVMPQLSSNWTGPDNQFVTTSLEDNTGWWWGTDNDGLWHFSPNAPLGSRWKHFRSVDGLYDDSITALCIDRKGRLWVGTERRGIAVYNNSWWQNYDFMTGPLGVHISSIAVNPVNGDVWMTSECGIAIYSDRTKLWRYITSADGLSSDKINCATFTPSGTAIIGTYSDGLLIGQPTDNYKTWVHVNALANATTSEVGVGIPGDQINCLLTTKSGKVFCGTSSGLAESDDSGATWQFLHGYKWQQKVTRSILATQQMHYDEPVPPLNDDFITSLAADQSGLVYIGQRRGGLDIYNDATQTILYHDRQIAYGIDIRSLTVLHKSGGILIGDYGGGISRWTLSGILSKSADLLPHNSLVTDFPVPASDPTGVQLEKIFQNLDVAPPGTSAPNAYFLSEDWQTQGNWVGRYGGQFAELCAGDGPLDYIANTTSGYVVKPNTGINGPGEISRWLEWDYTVDPRILYDPEIKSRRDSQWVDQGENNPILSEGPDLWLTVQVPAGAQRLALYFVNNDGHTRTTRFRDYLIQVMAVNSSVDYRSYYDHPDQFPVLAKARVENYWPGVYQNFVLEGPGSYLVHISRNFSLNTFLQGVFIDQLSPSVPQTDPAWMNGFSIKPSTMDTDAGGVETVQKQGLIEVKRLWSELDADYVDPISGSLQHTQRVLLLRAASADGASQLLLSHWRQMIGLWTGNDWTDYFDAVDKMNRAAAGESKQ